jgi:hypothetical protein
MAQSPDTVDVTGVVGDAATGQPIVGAVVELTDLSRKTVTLEGGRFVLFDLPPGPHDLRVSMLGYADWEETTPMEHLDLLRIGLLPKPVALENIKVTVDRLERQRKASAMSVTAVDRDDLVRSPYGDMASEIRVELESKTTAQRVPCSAGGSMLTQERELAAGLGDPLQLCVRWRGTVIQPTIVIDDFPADFATLSTYHPAELFAVEFYRNGQCIRAYTTRFIERGVRPLPVAAACGLY